MSRFYASKLGFVWIFSFMYPPLDFWPFGLLDLWTFGFLFDKFWVFVWVILASFLLANLADFGCFGKFLGHIWLFLGRFVSVWIISVIFWATFA